MSVLMRVILSIVALAISGVVDMIWTPVQTIVSANLAGAQFENSDPAAVASLVGMSLLHGVPGVVSLITFITLILIWALGWKGTTKGAAVILVMLGASAPHAFAFFDTTDKTEAMTIMPNESAFWIPDIGANKDSQTSLDSEAYLREKKIALKRFIIPHAKLSNSGGNWGYDAFVPTGRLIIVDRTPYNREWVRSAERGTAAKDESFPCQTKDGLNVTAEVTIAASVTEDQSPLFLHYFGVNNPAGDRSTNQVIFTSVYYGKSLTQVMDGIGRGYVQTLVCHEIGIRDFTTANNEYIQIIDNVTKAATTFLAARGIGVDYLGWAGTWEFDKDVQRAINDRYTGEKVAPVLAALQWKATVDALEGWDHKLPTSLTLFGFDINSVLKSLVMPPTDAPPTNKKP